MGLGSQVVHVHYDENTEDLEEASHLPPPQPFLSLTSESWITPVTPVTELQEPAQDVAPRTIDRDLGAKCADGTVRGDAKSCIWESGTNRTHNAVLY